MRYICVSRVVIFLLTFLKETINIIKAIIVNIILAKYISLINSRKKYLSNISDQQPTIIPTVVNILKEFNVCSAGDWGGKYIRITGYHIKKGFFGERFR